MFVILLVTILVLGLPLAALRALFNPAKTVEASRERKVGKIILGVYAVVAVFVALIRR